MGSIRTSARDVPPYYRKPTAARRHLANAISDELIQQIVSRVFSPIGCMNTERECYEVSRDLRAAFGDLEGVVARLLPGGRYAEGWVVGAKGMGLAAKIVLVVSDKINAEIIRPGPKPEDREADNLAAETWEIRGGIESLVAAVIAVDDEVRGLEGESQ